MRAIIPKRTRTALMKVGAVMCLLLPAAWTAAAGTPSAPASEYDLKAAFLFNFVHFVEWPAGAFANVSTPFTIGVLGTDPFGGSLDQIVRDETIGGRTLRVQRFHSLEEVANCQLLFVSDSERPRIDEILTRVKTRPVLTVSDTKGFAARSGTIGFVTVRHRVRLQINAAAAREQQLKISSLLLRQAQIVGPSKVRE